MSTAPAASTILVVDDDPNCLDIAARLLQHEGYRIRIASGGQEALRIVETEPVDLILLDVMMPGMDGFAVCSALQRAGRRIPVILLTAKDDNDTRLEGMHHGVAEFLTKPIQTRELFARVRAQLHIVELGRQLDTVEKSLQNLRVAGTRPDSSH